MRYLKKYSLSDLALQFLYEENPTVLDRTFAPLINGGRSGEPFHQEMATFPTVVERYDHHTGRHKEKQSQSSQYNSMMDKAKLMEDLHSSMTSSENHEIDLGYGIATTTDDIILSVIEDTPVQPRKVHQTSQSADKLLDSLYTKVMAKGSLSTPTNSKAQTTNRVKLSKVGNEDIEL
jgi:hypothetical protein